MARLKCPYCGEFGAVLHPEAIQSGAPITSSVSCKNPICPCYDALTYGYHPFMDTEKKEAYRRMVEAEQNESDFEEPEKALSKGNGTALGKRLKGGRIMDFARLKGKKILVVDDEPDIIEALMDLLDMCHVEGALDIHAAKQFLQKNHYDATVLDIMGVDGYGLLEVAIQTKVPALILTSHALSAEHFKKSIRNGAHIYLPKDKMYEIDEYLNELFASSEMKEKKSGRWFVRLAPFFNKIFDPNWKDSDPRFWADFRAQFSLSKEELESVL